MCLNVLELEDYITHDFCIVMTVRNRISNFRWRMVIVYGPTKHELSRDFLRGLGNICEQSPLPIILGGYFNLIREEADKNSDNYDHLQMEIFNEFIGNYQLRELKRSVQRSTWTNK